MADINLYKAGQKKNPVYKEKGVINSGMFISLAIMIIVFLVYAGVNYYTGSLQKKKLVELEEQIIQEGNSLSREELQRAVDFDRRANEINDLATDFDHHSPEKMFSNIQKLIVEGAALRSLSKEGDMIEAEIVTTNFLIVARQILSLKMSDYFQDAEVVSMGKTADYADEDTKIEFTIKMSI